MKIWSKRLSKQQDYAKINPYGPAQQRAHLRKSRGNHNVLNKEHI